MQSPYLGLTALQALQISRIAHFWLKNSLFRSSMLSDNESLQLRQKMLTGGHSRQLHICLESSPERTHQASYVVFDWFSNGLLVVFWKWSNPLIFGLLQMPPDRIFGVCSSPNATFFLIEPWKLDIREASPIVCAAVDCVSSNWSHRLDSNRARVDKMVLRTKWLTKSKTLLCQRWYNLKIHFEWKCTLTSPIQTKPDMAKITWLVHHLKKGFDAPAMNLFFEF